MNNIKKPGWDAKKIAEIAKKRFGGFETFFSKHEWDERGEQMMQKVQKRVADTYGSIENFVEHMENEGLFATVYEKILSQDNPEIAIFEFSDDWEPRAFGAFGVQDSDEIDLENYKDKLLLVAKLGKIIGVLELSSDFGHLADFSDPNTDTKDYNQAIKAKRYWELDSEVDNLTSEEGAFLTKQEALGFLKYRWKEKPLYNRDDPFDGNPSVWITAFHGFDPKSWGCVGWPSEGRRETVIKETTNPFIVMIWRTNKAENKAERGKVVGFYELSHEKGYRDKFTDEKHHSKGKGSWEYSLKALRAWEILSGYQPKIGDIIDTKHAKNAASQAMELSDNAIEKLRKLPRREVEVYGQERDINPELIIPDKYRNGDKNIQKGYVRGGAAQIGRYVVSEPKNTEKELYILELSGGCIDTFLGKPANGRKIIKLGLSISPQTRCNSFNHVLPNGVYIWKILHTTKQDGDEPYPDFNTAERGEMAMKKYLANAVECGHLGGEFYLAADENIDKAWEKGKEKS